MSSNVRVLSAKTEEELEQLIYEASQGFRQIQNIQYKPIVNSGGNIVFTVLVVFA